MLKVNFTQRTAQFWEWFSANEETLSTVAMSSNSGERDTERIVILVKEGVSLLAEDVNFNIGGEHEFTFSVSGNDALFFLYPYITANLPEQYRDKWTFFPSMPGTNGQNFGFKVSGLDAEMVDSNDVMVSVVRNESDRLVNLRFWTKAWEQLEEKLCLNAFFILMEVLIGEALSAYCVANIERASAPTDDMFPLTQLQQWLLDNVCENGKAPNPADMHSAYELEPKNMSEEPRSDVFVGATCYTPLIKDYLDYTDNTYKTFTGFGAKAVFLYFDYPTNDKSDQQAAFERRNAIMDELEEKVLGERGSGKEIGMLLGGAMGAYRAYIDLLLYDETSFIAKARELLKDESIMILCKEFVYDGKEFPLFGYDDPKLEERLQYLHECNAHHKILDILDALPKKNYTQIGIYAHALNNIQQYEKAKEVLEQIRGQQENDVTWHYRYGFSLFYLDKPNEAIIHFRKVVELGGNDDGFIAECEKKMKKPRGIFGLFGGKG
jgi:tetratricopeptide (TPR) repeat protein